MSTVWPEGYRVGEFYRKFSPKTVAANREYRRKIIGVCGKSASAREDVMAMCAADPLYAVNTFAWTVDPRKVRRKSAVPMVLWGDQVKALEQIVWCIVNGESLLIEKSRDQGASWICMDAVWWFTRFRELSMFLCTHIKEAKVDKSGSLKAALPKIDFVNKWLPSWMADSGWETNRSHLYRRSAITGSTVEGDSTTRAMGRGDRYTAVVWDECPEMGPANLDANSSLAKTTDCIIYNGTPPVSGEKEIQQILRDDGKTFVVSMHWSRHPEQRKGLYTRDADNNVVILDKEWRGRVRVAKVDHIFPDNYPFRGEHDEPGYLRSPEFDRTEDKFGGDRLILDREMNINYGAIRGRVFPEKVMHEHVRVNGREPFRRGEILFDRETAMPTGFEDRPDGRFKVWMDFDGEFPTTPIQAVVAADVANGLGASNSVISVGDITMRRKVAEYCDPNTPPHELALYCVAICHWLKRAMGNISDPFLIWEGRGPGDTLEWEVVRRLEYGNVYRMPSAGKWASSPGNRAGFRPSTDSKTALIHDLRQAYVDRVFENPCAESVLETLEYIYEDGNQVRHKADKSILDPSGAKSAHGDRVIADALLWKIIKERAGGRSDKRITDRAMGNYLDSCPPGSFGFELRERLARQRQEATTERLEFM